MEISEVDERAQDERLRREKAFEWIANVQSGRILCHCGAKADLRDSKVLYYGHSYGMAWVCSRYPKCNSYVGTHKGTDAPSGMLADKQMREARKKDHAAFDPLWQEKEFFTTRGKAYSWMRSAMDLPKELAHIAMMDVRTCERLMEKITELRTEKEKCSEEEEEKEEMDNTMKSHECPKCGGTMELADYSGRPMVQCSGCMTMWTDLFLLDKAQKAGGRVPPPPPEPDDPTRPKIEYEHDKLTKVRKAKTKRHTLLDYLWDWARGDWFVHELIEKMDMVEEQIRDNDVLSIKRTMGRGTITVLLNGKCIGEYEAISQFLLEDGGRLRWNVED